MKNQMEKNMDNEYTRFCNLEIPSTQIFGLSAAHDYDLNGLWYLIPGIQVSRKFNTLNPKP